MMSYPVTRFTLVGGLVFAFCSCIVGAEEDWDTLFNEVTKCFQARDYKAAIEMCRKFLISNGNSPAIPDSVKARMQILLGDAYFRDERYEIAREEYVAVLARWPDTQEASEAHLKSGQSLMFQKIWGKAEEIFKHLTESTDKEIAKRAHLMLGILYFMEGDRKKAEEKFEEVFSRYPSSDVGELLLFLSGRAKTTYGSLPVASCNYRSRSVVEPGRELHVRVSDRDLEVQKSSSNVPIMVKTTAGDEEVVQVSRSELGRGLWVGSILTELGKPVPKDKKLQVVGRDIITWDSHLDAEDVWSEKKNQAKGITIAANAELEISSAEFKEDSEPVLIDPFLFSQGKPTSQRQLPAWNGFTPGNSIYLQVKDPDRDIGDERDNVPVIVKASSGDKIRLNLEEVESHTGIFRDSVKTRQSTGTSIDLTDDFLEIQVGDTITAIYSDEVNINPGMPWDLQVELSVLRAPW